MKTICQWIERYFWRVLVVLTLLWLSWLFRFEHTINLYFLDRWRGELLVGYEGGGVVSLTKLHKMYEKSKMEESNFSNALDDIDAKEKSDEDNPCESKATGIDKGIDDAFCERQKAANQPGLSKEVPFANKPETKKP